MTLLRRWALLCGALVVALVATLQVPAVAGAPTCFYVHRSGAGQILYNAQYNRLLFTHSDMNDGSHFDFTYSVWTAPAAGRINLAGQAHVWGLAIWGQEAALKFILNSTLTNLPPAQPNGSDIFSPIGGPVAGNGSGTGPIGGSGWWHVNQGDRIELALLTFSITGYNYATVDGNRAHTYWSGCFFPS